MRANFTALVIALGLASGVAGCASAGGKDMLSANAPRSLPEAGQVSVTWEDPAGFTEVRQSHNRPEVMDGDWLVELAEHMRKRAENRLSDGERLVLTIVDVDLAGDFEPWQGMQAADTRIVRDIYPPQMTVHYKHTDATGKVIAEGERKLSDPAFQTGANPGNSNDTLRYEKRMIDNWLRGSSLASR